jgi:hypothetical protein
MSFADQLKPYQDRLVDENKLLKDIKERIQASNGIIAAGGDVSVNGLLQAPD